VRNRNYAALEKLPGAIYLTGPKAVLDLAYLAPFNFALANPKSLTNTVPSWPTKIFLAARSCYT